MRKKVAISVYLLPVQLAGLRARAAATRLPVAMLIRDAIDEYLDAGGGVAPGTIRDISNARRAR